ncbi:MAG TPA: hypothetical protein VM299_01255 [Solirubrobacteraceae bacterium]|jgi:hypothetical protein|nr:hypothetical protein [Solirubrobacteraceae bacterium]
MTPPAVIACIAALAVFGAWSPAATAHGPCDCLDPVLTRPGGTVRLTDHDGSQAGGTGWPAYRVVFNPRPADLGIAPVRLTSAHRADAPTTTVLSRPRSRPTRRGAFRVPAGTPPGLYMVLILDGQEGGAHNSWDYLHVAVDRDDGRDRGVVAAPAMRQAEGGGSTTPTSWLVVAGVGLGGLAVGAAGGAAAARRRRT